MPIHKVRRFMRDNPRMALGLQVAMTVLAHNKAAAGGMSAPAGKRAAVLASIPTVTGIPTAIKNKAQKVVNESQNLDEVTSAVWDVSRQTAAEGVAAHPATPEPMSYEQARLWLQAYNAGPYALLRNKGTVPYKETQNYVPRVMKYYRQNLSNSPYDKLIEQSARKYGLDPQMVRAVMKTESDFDNDTVSHAGARGLMQVMPVVWKDITKRYGVNWEYSSGVFEPEKNIEVACAYLSWLRYDFLPRHFAAFEQSGPPPRALVRDNAPPRQSAKIVTEVAQAAAQEHKAAITQPPRIVKAKPIVEMVQSSRPGGSMTRPAAPARTVKAPSVAREASHQGG